MKYRRGIISAAGFLFVATLVVLLGGCNWIRHPTISTGHDVEDALSRKPRSAPLSASQAQALVMNFGDLYVTSVRGFPIRDITGVAFSNECTNQKED